MYVCMYTYLECARPTKDAVCINPPPPVSIGQWLQTPGSCSFEGRLWRWGSKLHTCQQVRGSHKFESVHVPQRPVWRIAVVASLGAAARRLPVRLARALVHEIGRTTGVNEQRVTVPQQEQKGRRGGQGSEDSNPVTTHAFWVAASWHLRRPIWLCAVYMRRASRCVSLQPPPFQRVRQFPPIALLPSTETYRAASL